MATQLDIRRFNVEPIRQGVGARVDPNALAAPGRALQGGAGQLADAAARHRQAINEIKATRALAKLQADFLTEFEARAVDPTLNETLLSDSQELAQRLLDDTLADVDDEQLRRQITLGAERFFLGRQPHIAKRALDQANGLARADVDEALANYQTLYARAADEDAEQTAIEGMRSVLETAVTSGVLDPAAARKLGEQARDDAIEAKVLEQLTVDPAAVRDILRSPSELRGFDEKRRSVLLLRAERAVREQEAARLRRIDRADRLAEKARKRAQESRTAELAAAILADPNAVTDDVLINDVRSGGINGTQFSSLLGLRRRESEEDEGEGSVQAELALLQSVLNGDSTQEQIVDAPIRPETKTELLNLHERVNRQGGPLARRDARDALEFIDQVIGGVRGPFAILDTASSERIANAQREFIERFEAEPTQNPSALADDIVSRYRLQRPTIDSLPSPRFRVGPRGDPDLAATERATVQAFRDGELTPEEFEREAALLEQIAELQRNER